MRKTFLVIKREYLEHVRSKSFIIGTILAPVVMLLLYSIPIVSILLVPDEQLRVAVLDRTGAIGTEFIASVTDTLKDGRPRYVMTNVSPADGDFDAQRENLIESIKRDALDVLIEVPGDVLTTGRVNYVAENVLNDEVIDYLEALMNPIVISHRFSEEGIRADRITALTERIDFKQQKITKAGVLEDDEVAGDIIVAIVFVMILYFMLLTWGMSVQRSIIEEKGSRVIEVMLSSVEPRDMFFGKILGIGAVGFTQIAIWSAIFLALAFSSAFVAAQVFDYVQISVIEVIAFMVFFVLGFLFYAAMFTVIGSMCSTERDAQQLQTIVIMPIVLPIMLMFLVIQTPDSMLAVVLSLIPFFAPMLMLARISVSEPPLWQVLLSIVILLASIYGVVIFSAKVFRVGILMYGKRPSLKEVFRWARVA